MTFIIKLKIKNEKLKIKNGICALRAIFITPAAESRKPRRRRLKNFPADTASVFHFLFFVFHFYFILFSLPIFGQPPGVSDLLAYLFLVSFNRGNFFVQPVYRVEHWFFSPLADQLAVEKTPGS